MRWLKHTALLALLAALSSGCEKQAFAGFTIGTSQIATSGAGPFLPTSLSGCVEWLRSDLGITTVSGAVSVWANQGTLGSAGNATQSTAGLRPAYAASGGLNNRAKLTFLSSAPNLLNWGYAGTGTKTVVIVLKLNSTPGTGFSVYETFNNSAGTLYSEMILDFATYQNTSFVDDWFSTTGMFGHNDVIGSTVGHVFTHTYNNGTQVVGSYTANFDGTTKTVVTSGAYGNSDTASHIGGRSGGSFSLNADVYEIIAYSRVLSGSEITQLYNYEKALYAL